MTYAMNSQLSNFVKEAWKEKGYIYISLYTYMSYKYVILSASKFILELLAK